MQKIKVLSLITLILLGLSLGLSTSFTQAQTDPQRLLAEAAAKNFLVTLTRPALIETHDFYLSDTVDQDLLSDLIESNFTSYTIVNTIWLDTDAYQVEALLQPGNRIILLDVQKPNYRWLVVDITKKANETTVESLTENDIEIPIEPDSATTIAASSTGLSGKLVFQTRSGGDIFMINADGTGLRWITQGIDPELSPDGNHLVFTRWDEAEYGALYIFDLTSGEEYMILSGVLQAKSPTWSPDGQSIIFAFQQGTRRLFSEEICDIFDFGEPIHIRRTGGRIWFLRSHIGFSGIKVCYLLAPDTQWQLGRVKIATGEFEDIPSDLYSYGPSWHPALVQQWIYKGERGLILYDAHTHTNLQVSYDFQDHTPVISPDGLRVAVSYRQHDHWEVHTMNIDGTDRRRLTRTPLTILARKDLIEQKEIDGALRFVPTQNQHWNNAAPVWSPDGHYLAFLTDRTGQWEIWFMNTDGTNQQPMFANGALDHLTFDYAGMDERMLSWHKP